MMFSMGTTLRRKDFALLLTRPTTVLVGLASQLLLLPLIALLLLSPLELPVAIYAGFVILALSPGGTTSNVFSYMAQGNVALSITLTACVSLIAPFTLPVAANYLLAERAGLEAFALPVLPTVMRLFAITVVPVVLGMAFRSRRTATCQRYEVLFTRVPFFMLLGVIGGIVHQNWSDMPQFLRDTGLPAMLLASCALALAYGVARLLGRGVKDSRTIAIETAIQNGGTAMLVTGTLLKSPAMTVAPVMYGIIMLVPVLLLLLLQRFYPPERQEA